MSKAGRLADPKEVRAHLIAAAAAGLTTLALFSAVASFAEPQRGVLVAKTQQAERLRAAAKAPVAVAMAAEATARQAK